MGSLIGQAAGARIGRADCHVMHTQSRRAEKVDKLLLCRYQSAAIVAESWQGPQATTDR
jgi:hypothetical protein